VKFYISPTHFASQREFIIRDEDQNKLFRIKGRFLFSMRWLKMRDMNDAFIYGVRKHFTLGFIRRYHITDDERKIVASIKRTYGFLRPKFTVSVAEDTYQVDGSLYQHRFEITKDGETYARISKSVFSFGDAFEIEVLHERSPLLFMFLIVTIDQFLHERKKFFK